MKILAIGDPHGELNKIKRISMKGIDLILLTGDIGKVDLARKRSFDNIERRKKGLPEKVYAPKQNKESYMQIYNSTIKILKYLSRFAPVYMISGNVERTDEEVRELSNSIGLKIPLM